VALIYSPSLAVGTAGIPSTFSQAVQAAQPLLQRPFTTAFAQYLGQISYSLYLAHNSVNHIVGTRWLNPAHDQWQAAQQKARDLGGGGQARMDDMLLGERKAYLQQAAWGIFINTLVLFWISDVFWRAVDARALKVTRSLSLCAAARG
jgi:hypothetical protein